MRQYYYQILPIDIRDSLLWYVQTLDLIEVTYNDIKFANRMYDNMTFWTQKLKYDFTMPDQEEYGESINTNNVLGYFTHKTIYHIASIIYPNLPDDRCPWSRISIEILIHTLSDYECFTKTTKQLIDILLTDSRGRNLLITIGDVSMLQYIYDNYPQYRTPILVCLLLYHDNYTRNKFIKRNPNLPTFPYNTLSKLIGACTSECLAYHHRVGYHPFPVESIINIEKNKMI